MIRYGANGSKIYVSHPVSSETRIIDAEMNLQPVEIHSSLEITADISASSDLENTIPELAVSDEGDPTPIINDEVFPASSPEIEQTHAYKSRKDRKREARDRSIFGESGDLTSSDDTDVTEDK